VSTVLSLRSISGMNLYPEFKKSGIELVKQIRFLIFLENRAFARSDSQGFKFKRLGTKRRRKLKNWQTALSISN
jgi:hypothetical protein